MSTLRALIVDDERLARVELRRLLTAHPELEIVGEAASAREAAQLAQSLLPDVIFLDIHLGSASGFELLSSLPSAARIIFVTAHHEYAVRAFDVNAVDYLLKPVQGQRLAEALRRLGQIGAAAPRLTYDDRLLLPGSKQFTLVKVGAIESIHAAGDYSEVQLDSGPRLLILRSLREWEERLPEKHFVRIHRSTIVNLDAVERLEEWDNSAFRIHLRNQREPLLSSRRYASALRARFA